MPRMAEPAASSAARAVPTSLRLHRRSGAARGPTPGVAPHRPSALEAPGPASLRWCKSVGCCTGAPPGPRRVSWVDLPSARPMASRPGPPLPGCCHAATPAGIIAPTGMTTASPRAAGATGVSPNASVARASSTRSEVAVLAPRPATSACRRWKGVTRPAMRSSRWPAAPPAPPPRCQRMAAARRHRRGAQPASRTRAAPLRAGGHSDGTARVCAPAYPAHAGPSPTTPPSAAGVALATACAAAHGAQPDAASSCSTTLSGSLALGRATRPSGSSIRSRMTCMP